MGAAEADLFEADLFESDESAFEFVEEELVDAAAEDAEESLDPPVGVVLSSSLDLSGPLCELAWQKFEFPNMMLMPLNSPCRWLLYDGYLAKVLLSNDRMMLTWRLYLA